MNFGTAGAERESLLNSETPKKPMKGAARPTGCRGGNGTRLCDEEPGPAGLRRSRHEAETQTGIVSVA